VATGHCNPLKESGSIRSLRRTYNNLRTYFRLAYGLYGTVQYSTNNAKNLKDENSKHKLKRSNGPNTVSTLTYPMPPNPASTASTSAGKRKATRNDNGDPDQLPTKKSRQQPQKKPETVKGKLDTVSNASKLNTPTESGSKRNSQISDDEDYDEPPPPLYVDSIDSDDDDDDAIEIIEEPEEEEGEKLC